MPCCLQWVPLATTGQCRYPLTLHHRTEAYTARAGLRCLREPKLASRCATCRRGLLLVRGIFGFGAIGNYLWAVTLLPLNDTLVLTFTAPIWAAVLGPFLINEKASK